MGDECMQGWVRGGLPSRESVAPSDTFVGRPIRSIRASRVPASRSATRSPDPPIEFRGAARVGSRRLTGAVSGMGKSHPLWNPGGEARCPMAIHPGAPGRTQDPGMSSLLPPRLPRPPKLVRLSRDKRPLSPLLAARLCRSARFSARSVNARPHGEVAAVVDVHYGLSRSDRPSIGGARDWRTLWGRRPGPPTTRPPPHSRSTPGGKGEHPAKIYGSRTARRAPGAQRRPPRASPSTKRPQACRRRPQRPAEAV